MDTHLSLLKEYSFWINAGCLLWLLFCWIGYARFARTQAKRTDCLASIMHQLRLAWMREVLEREQRVWDAAIIANLERNVSFMASTSILVLAGLVTAMTSTEVIYTMLSGLHITSVASAAELQFKLLVLVCIFVYTFFTFTWSLRQFGFSSVILGATPIREPGSYPDSEREEYARHSGKVLDQAAHTYNYGLRAYYYAMAMLAWFIHPLLFIAAVAMVVWVLYQREFKSNTLNAMLQVQKKWHNQSQRPCQTSNASQTKS